MKRCMGWVKLSILAAIAFLADWITQKKSDCVVCAAPPAFARDWFILTKPDILFALAVCTGGWVCSFGHSAKDDFRCGKITDNFSRRLFVAAAIFLFGISSRGRLAEQFAISLLWLDACLPKGNHQQSVLSMVPWIGPARFSHRTDRHPISRYCSHRGCLCRRPKTQKEPGIEMGAVTACPQSGIDRPVDIGRSVF